jgi:hypothetical protein
MLAAGVLKHIVRLPYDGCFHLYPCRANHKRHAQLAIVTQAELKVSLPVTTPTVCLRRMFALAARLYIRS